MDDEREWLRQAKEAARDGLSMQSRIWAGHSGDKADVALGVARVLRSLHGALPDGWPLRALSIGSSSEPQLGLLAATCEGGVHLLDVDDDALFSAINRAEETGLHAVHAVCGDYREVLESRESAAAFREEHLDGHRADLILFHHSLYYAPATEWLPLIRNAWMELAAPVGAIHAVLMAARTDDPDTTTALYERFAGKWFGHRNDQCLRAFAAVIRAEPEFAGATAAERTARVSFHEYGARFLMSVVWMVLLHPHVHRFPPKAVREIATYVRERGYSEERPLSQVQDHLAVFRGLDGRPVLV